MKRNINIERLIVNPENYRFDAVDNQNEAIELMLEEKGDELVNLAKHIYEKGLDKARDSRVLEIKKNLFLVLDGNRRVTAIKCLENPSLIKSEFLRNKFLKILKNSGIIPSEVNCFVYTEEKEAAEWIKLDHTGKNAGVGQDAWEPAGKERFDYKFGGKISPAMQILKFFQQETEKSIDTKALKISTVNRIISNPESRSYIGIDIRGGNVVLIAKKNDVLNRLDTLFNKIIVDDVAVKEVYHVPDSIKFMKNLFNDKPKNLLRDSSGIKAVSIQNNGLKRKRLPKSSARKYLIPKECILMIKPKKINNIYRELQDDLLLDDTPMSTPNAVGVLFRVFLEVSLDYYSEKECGKTFKPEETINQKIEAVTKYMETQKIATSKQLSPIRIVSSGKKKDILHIQRFHEYVHSSIIQPDSASLKAKWENLQEFFEILWGDLEQKKK